MESAVCRIIDANFNRAREAMRVVEEFCRFALNSTTLAARAKARQFTLFHFSPRYLGQEDLIYREASEAFESH